MFNAPKHHRSSQLKVGLSMLMVGKLLDPLAFHSSFREFRIKVRLVNANLRCHPVCLAYRSIISVYCPALLGETRNIKEPWVHRNPRLERKIRAYRTKKEKPWASSVPTVESTKNILAMGALVQGVYLNTIDKCLAIHQSHCSFL
jgi:hypothetical protein